MYSVYVVNFLEPTVAVGAMCVMMDCCMISPVCSTAVLATNMDTGDRRVLQHSNTAYCEHGILDKRHHIQGIWKFQIIYTVSFTVCIQ